MAACKEALGDQVGHEFLKAQVEVDTRVCDDIAEVRADLVRLRGGIARAAERFDLAAVAASTHPFADWRAQHHVPLARYEFFAREMQIVVRRLATCGMHVHVAVEDEELRIDLMRQATYFLPHLLALSASSPFWMGEDTGLCSYRPSVFHDLPRTGLPEYLDGWNDWQALLRLMQAAGCDEGSKIWWDLRPSVKYPTLELRVCDVCTRIDDAVAIAAVFRCLLAFLYRLRRSNQSWRVYPQILVAENKWRAQRYGVGGELADFGVAALKPFGQLTGELLELIQPEAEALGCSAEVDQVRTIVRRGTSADAQRRVYHDAKAGGADEVEAMRSLVDWLARETVAGLESALEHAGATPN
jgi:carboxylate-amine ligase